MDTVYSWLRVWAWRWDQPRRQVSYKNSHCWGYSEPFWGTFSKIRVHVHYKRSKDYDGSRFFRGAFIRGGNNFVFNPEANSLLFREFLPWLKQHQFMMPRKLRKSNNSLLDILNSASRILQCWSYYVKIHHYYINTTPKELKTERDCSHRQLFRPFWGSSVLA